MEDVMFFTCPPIRNFYRYCKVSSKKRSSNLKGTMPTFLRYFSIDPINHQSSCTESYTEFDVVKAKDLLHNRPPRVVRSETSAFSSASSLLTSGERFSNPTTYRWWNKNGRKSYIRGNLRGPTPPMPSPFQGNKAIFGDYEPPSSPNNPL